MFGVGRALCGSPSPTLLPKQGHPEQAAQHRGQAGLEYLQRRRTVLTALTSFEGCMGNADLPSQSQQDSGCIINICKLYVHVKNIPGLNPDAKKPTETGNSSYNLT